MKKILIMAILSVLGFSATAQLTDAERIVGTWKLDSVVMEEVNIEMSQEELELMEVMKSLVFLKFSSDSTVVMPDFESDFNGEGDVPTVVSKYFFKDDKLHLVKDDDILDYQFISDDYLELMEDGESMFFRKE